MGLDKKAQIAAIQQARFYLQRQAAVPQLIYCGASVHEPQYTRDYLVYCGTSYTAAAIYTYKSYRVSIYGCYGHSTRIAAAVHEPQYMRDKKVS